MQRFPHCFEVAERHLELDALEMDGSPTEKRIGTRALTQLQHLGWTIRVSELRDFEASSLISTSVAEFFARALRHHLTSQECFLRHDLLRNNKVTAKMRLTPHSPPASLPARTFLPYKTEKSLRWSLFVLRRTPATDAFSLDCHFPHGVDERAFAAPRRYLMKTFQIREADVTTIRAEHSDFCDGDFFWFIHAAFSQKPLADVEADARADFLSALKLVRELTDEALEAAEPSIQALLDADSTLGDRFHALFKIPSATLPREAHDFDATGSQLPGASVSARKKRPTSAATGAHSDFAARARALLSSLSRPQPTPDTTHSRKRHADAAPAPRGGASVASVTTPSEAATLPRPTHLLKRLQHAAQQCADAPPPADTADARREEEGATGAAASNTSAASDTEPAAPSSPLSVQAKLRAGTPASQEIHLSNYIVSRRLLPLWMDACATGHKHVEFQRYKSSGNALKPVSAGTMMLLGPMGDKGVPLHAIGITGDSPQRSPPSA